MWVNYFTVTKFIPIDDYEVSNIWKISYRVFQKIENWQTCDFEWNGVKTHRLKKRFYFRIYEIKSLFLIK